MNQEVIHTVLTDVCAGDSADELFAVAKVHPENFPLDAVSLLLRIDVSNKQPTHEVLINARKQIDDEEDCSSFECIVKDGDLVLIGNSGGDSLSCANGDIKVLGFDKLKPRPGGVYSACWLGHGHAFFGAFHGIVIEHRQGQAVAKKVFDADVAYQSVAAMHGLGADHVIAVGGDGLAARFDGHEWRDIQTPTDERLTGVWCRSRSDVYVSGKGLWHWDGADGWTHIDSPFESDQAMCDVVAYQGHVYVAAGIHGMLRLESSGLVPVDIGSSAVVGKLRTTQAGLIGLGAWGDGGGWLVRFDGQTWTCTELDLSDEYLE